jgi:aspartyl-tRNA synthetase
MIFYKYRAEKEQMKLEKKAKKEAERLAEETANNLPIPDVMYININEQETYTPYGDMKRIMSRSETGRNFIMISEIESNPKLYPENTKIWISGRLQSIRVKGGSCFLVIRQNSFHTIQCVYFKQSNNGNSTPEEIYQQQQMIKYLKSLTVESIIQLQGSVVTNANVKSCTVQTIELQIDRIHTVSRAESNLPFQIEDAARSENDIELSQSTDRPYPRLGQEIRLDNRWIDLRVPANNAILRIQSAVCQLFRESLYGQGFIEIHSPKLVAGESESGAGAFTTDYFGQTACLAQSPQLYKQMAISSDFNRVFEIGPVFRAEKSHTRRHLCEFTGLDIEMSINDHYIETLRVVHTMFKYIFNGLETRYKKELEIIREQYTSEPVTFTDEPCIIHWDEAMDILQNQLKYDIGDGLQDLTGAMELSLGQVIKEKYGTDFFMLDKYPSNVRPFYTMPDPDDKQYSNSYDMFLRGQEICSGAQRCHDPILVQELIKEKNIVPGDVLLKYIESFQHGVSPHAGAGIGLERVVFLYLNLDNVRKASMFPRDPNRCVP